MNYGILFHSKYWVIQVLQANVGQLASRDLAEEMKRLHSATVHVNPRLLSVGVQNSHHLRSLQLILRKRQTLIFNRHILES